MDLNKAIQSRKSVRKFTSRKPDWRDIIECVDAARHAPLAGGIPTLKFILVSNKEKIYIVSVVILGILFAMFIYHIVEEKIRPSGKIKKVGIRSIIKKR